jgi:uroporphyrinogen-III decarboxylase
MLLAKCSDYVRDHLAALRKAGADVIFYANPFASTDFLPLKLIEKMALPWMLRDLQGDSMDGLVFFCAMAHLNHSLHLAIEQAGFRIVYLSPLDDVATGKRIVAGRALTGAAFNDIVLPRLSEQQIREGVRNILAAGIPGGRFLFGTVLMPWRIPQRNIHTLFEAACEFGAETFQ